MKDFVVALLFLVAQSSHAQTSALQNQSLDKAFRRSKVTIGGKTLSVYVADTDERREKGLMFVRELQKDSGMIFIFEEERPLAFWMKNTLIPLSIGFFNKEGILVDIQEMDVPDSIMDQRPPSYPSKKPAMYALEMSRNWFAVNKIKVGAKFTLERRTRP